MKFLELPELMIQQVLEYLSYDEVAKSRIVSKIEISSLDKRQIIDCFNLCLKITKIGYISANLEFFIHNFASLSAS